MIKWNTKMYQFTPFSEKQVGKKEQGKERAD